MSQDIMIKINPRNDKEDVVTTLKELSQKRQKNDMYRYLKDSGYGVQATLLKPGGSLIIHGEHYDPVFLRPKARKGLKQLHTIPQFPSALQKVGLKPKVFRYALPGGRRPVLKRLLLTVWPFCLVNGWFRFSSFMMLASKPF